LKSHVKSLNHVAIIMDGNGRWAKYQGKPRLFGHRRGAENVKSIIEECISQKIPYLTVYAFSTENWHRPQEEVQGLMNLLRFYLKNEIKTFKKQGVSLRMIGERSRLDKDIQDLIIHAEEETKDNSILTLQVALNYGSREEITEAFRKMIRAGLDVSQITEKKVGEFLYTAGVPDPDLFIRTSGECRVSNFLLWQSAYAEFYFTETFWPDFSKQEFQKALADYNNRERRFGKTSEQVQ